MGYISRKKHFDQRTLSPFVYAVTLCFGLLISGCHSIIEFELVPDERNLNQEQLRLFHDGCLVFRGSYLIGLKSESEIPDNLNFLLNESLIEFTNRKNEVVKVKIPQNYSCSPLVINTKTVSTTIYPAPPYQLRNWLFTSDGDKYLVLYFEESGTVYHERFLLKEQ